MLPIGNKHMLVLMGGLWACTFMVFIYGRELSKRITASPTYIEALEMLRQHKGAVYYLGEPIEEIKSNATGSCELVDGKISKYKFKTTVIGPKSDGIVFVNSVPGIDDELLIDEVHLQIGNDTTKRLIIKKSSVKTENK